MTAQLQAAIRARRVVVQRPQTVAGNVMICFAKQFVKHDLITPDPITISTGGTLDLTALPGMTIARLASSNLDRLIMSGALRLV